MSHQHSRYYELRIMRYETARRRLVDERSILALPDECLNIEIENKAGTVDSIQLHAESCEGCEFSYLAVGKEVV